MKFSLPFYLALTLGAITAPQYSQSSPVVEETIPDAIDWFVHLDAELLRSTEAGSAFINEFRAIAPADLQKMPIDPLLILDGLEGLTVFGSMPNFTGEGPQIDAVVILEGTSDLIQIFRGLVSGLQIEQPESVVAIENDPNGTLSLMGGEFYGAWIDDDRLAVSKALPSLNNFFEVYRGSGKHVNLQDRFAIYGDEQSNGIYFGAFVEGLSEFEDLPVQARILKLTQAVSVQLGESGDTVNLLASLMTDTEQTAYQVNEVLKGLVAIFALTNAGNADLTSLVQSANVSLNERTVTLGVSYPIESAVQWASVLADQAQAAMEAKEAAKVAAEALAEAEAAAAEAAQEAESVDEPAVDPAS